MTSDKLKNKCVKIIRSGIKDPKQFEKVRILFGQWFDRGLKNGHIVGGIIRHFDNDFTKSIENAERETPKEA